MANNYEMFWDKGGFTLQRAYKKTCHKPTFRLRPLSSVKSVHAKQDLNRIQSLPNQVLLAALCIVRVANLLYLIREFWVTFDYTLPQDFSEFEIHNFDIHFLDPANFELFPSFLKLWKQSFDSVLQRNHLPKFFLLYFNNHTYNQFPKISFFSSCLQNGRLFVNIFLFIGVMGLLFQATTNYYCYYYY